MDRQDEAAESYSEQLREVESLAQRLVRDPSLADDLVQETMLVSLERQPPGSSRLMGWLKSVLRFRLLDHRRSAHRRRRREQEASDHESDEPSQLPGETAELTENLRQALSELDEKYREVVELRYFHDLVPREIAREKGIPLETVRTRLRRALEQLRAKLDRSYGGDRHAWGVVLLASAGWRAQARVWTAGKAALVAALLVLSAFVGWRLLLPVRGAGAAELAPVELTGIDRMPPVAPEVAESPAPAADRIEVPTSEIPSTVASPITGTAEEEPGQRWIVPRAGAESPTVLEGVTDSDPRLGDMEWSRRVAPRAVRMLAQDPDGQPIDDVRARLHVSWPALQVQEGRLLPTTTDHLSQTASSAEDGAVGFEKLMPQRFLITLSRPGYARIDRKLQARRDEDPEQRVVLTPEAVVQGRVLTPQGQPAADCIVQARTGEELRWRSTRTDADGSYRLPAVSSGTTALRAFLPGTSPAGCALTNRDTMAGEVLEWSPTLEARGRLEGRVSGPVDGNHWIVAARRAGGGLNDVHWTEVVEGAFQFQALEDADYLVTLHPVLQPRQPPHAWIAAARPDGEPIELAPDREQAGSARVELSFVDFRARPAMLVSPVLESLDHPQLTYRVTLDQKTAAVEFGNLPPGRYRLMAKRRSVPAYENLIELKPDETLELGTVHIPRQAWLTMHLDVAPEMVSVLDRLQPRNGDFGRTELVDPQAGEDAPAGWIFSMIKDGDVVPVPEQNLRYEAGTLQTLLPAGTSYVLEVTRMVRAEPTSEAARIPFDFQGSLKHTIEVDLSAP